MERVDALADTRAQLTAAWDVRGIDVATVASEEDVLATRRRMAARPVGTETLPPLLSSADGAPAPFELGRTLGQGGMGLVRAATQRALGREVAIKSLNEGADASAAAQLLREARVTGALEHPNIVPVHALGVDALGQPVIVMKRIDGVAWEEAMDDDRDGDHEPFLRRHLTILLQVVRAVAFAHDRGVIHRDIKPANVMLGAEDEVYLVDWGIAVGTDKGKVRGLPGVESINAIEGTPSYMAPEMAAANPELIGTRTDVYLLGATLFDVLTGAPPHEGKTLMEVLTHAFASGTRSYPEWVPDGVRSICDRAMARDVEDRYASARELGRAIEEVLEHRASVILTDQASARLAELEDLVARIDDAEVRQIHTRFAECRFAFAHALETWPDNRVAQRGLARAVKVMVRAELARGAPEAAATLLRDLPTPEPELEEAVTHMLEEQRRKGAHLERFVKEADVVVGARERGYMAVALGVVWLLAFCVLQWLSWAGRLPNPYVALLGLFGFFFVASVVTAYAVRKTLTNRMSRKTMGAVIAHYVMHMTTVAYGWIFGLTPSAVSAAIALTGGIGFSTALLFLDRAVWPMVVAVFVGLVAIIIYPDHHFLILGLGGSSGAFLSARNLFASRSAFDEAS